MKKFGKILLMFAMVAMVFVGTQSTAKAAEMPSVKDGTYSVSASLKCYVNAMGGVEFGAPLLKSAEVTFKDGKGTMKIYLRKSSVTIYSITCDTFIDKSAGTIGYYDKNGSLQTSGVKVSNSSDTALNPANEAVPYVSSISFPLDQKSGTYKLALYVNSNVMGAQFGAGGSSDATLSVDWSNVPFEESSDKNNTSNDASSSGDSSSSGSTNNSGNTSNSGNSNNAGNTGSIDKKPATNTGSTSSGNTGSGSTGSTKTSTNSTSSSNSTSTSGDETSNTTVATDADAAIATDDATTEQSEAEVVEKDGLNIHYADGESDDVSAVAETGEDTDQPEGKKPVGVIVVVIVIVVAAAAVGYIVKRKMKEGK